MTNDLQDRFIFLSASYPRRQYQDTADSQEIASAVKAFLGAVFHAGGKVVFGGHPSISPLVLMLARECRQKESVRIFQSKAFEADLSEATLRLRDEGYGEISLTNLDPMEFTQSLENPNPEDFPRSLAIMREAMLSRSDTNPAAGVFIGGDTGILKEQTLFSANLPGAPWYAVGGPGGAAREMAEKLIDSNPSPLHKKLATSRNYIALMLEVVRDIKESLSRKTMVAGR